MLYFKPYYSYELKKNFTNYDTLISIIIITHTDTHTCTHTYTHTHIHTYAFIYSFLFYWFTDSTINFLCFTRSLVLNIHYIKRSITHIYCFTHYSIHTIYFIYRNQFLFYE